MVLPVQAAAVAGTFSEYIAEAGGSFNDVSVVPITMSDAVTGTCRVLPGSGCCVDQSKRIDKSMAVRCLVRAPMEM